MNPLGVCVFASHTTHSFAAVQSTVVGFQHFERLHAAADADTVAITASIAALNISSRLQSVLKDGPTRLLHLRLAKFMFRKRKRDRRRTETYGCHIVGVGIKVWRLFSDQYDHVDGRRAFLFAANAKLLNVLVQQKWMK